jgi:hypothetical protein
MSDFLNVKSPGIVAFPQLRGAIPSGIAAVLTYMLHCSKIKTPLPRRETLLRENCMTTKVLPHSFAAIAAPWCAA